MGEGGRHFSEENLNKTVFILPVYLFIGVFMWRFFFWTQIRSATRIPSHPSETGLRSGAQNKCRSRTK